VAELWQTLGQLLHVVVHLLVQLQPVIAALVLLLAWTAWWLWAVNWQKAWPILAGGAWVPLVLLMIVVALVWSRLAPVESFNFWAQFGGVALLVGLALFSGWLQGVMHWTPAEVALEPPASERGHEHHAA
jgi:hypothetical protein